MGDSDIDILLKMGFWVQVSPVISNDKQMWNCELYKKTKKTWGSYKVKSFKTPNESYAGFPNLKRTEDSLTNKNKL